MEEQLSCLIQCHQMEETLTEFKQDAYIKFLLHVSGLKQLEYIYVALK